MLPINVELGSTQILGRLVMALYSKLGKIVLTQIFNRVDLLEQILK